MAQAVSTALGVDAKSLEKKGIFDAVIGVDIHLFVDPQLLKQTSIPEFKNSHDTLEKYFSEIITLLSASKNAGDRPWKEAYKRLIFKELHGVSIGYGVHSDNGSAVGPELASKLVHSASEILALGIKDPEVFLLLGLFEEGFGADRLSDTTIFVLKDDFYLYTQRMAKELGIKSLIKKVTPNGQYLLPKNPNKNEGLMFLPKELLRDLPVALDRDGIDFVVAVNQELRNRLNQMIGTAWKSKITKKELRNIVFPSKDNMETLLEAYKNNKKGVYDFEKDPVASLEVANWMLKSLLTAREMHPEKVSFHF